MSIHAILFYLDGTLLPMNQDLFMKYYFGALAEKLVPLGYNKDTLVNNIWTGTKAMVMNDGNKTNEDAFWDTFCQLAGKDCRQDIPIFDSFYRNEFIAAKNACETTTAAKDLIHFIQSNKKRLILATNPIFPFVATENRIQWAVSPFTSEHSL